MAISKNKTENETNITKVLFCLNKLIFVKVTHKNNKLKNSTVLEPVRTSNNKHKKNTNKVVFVWRRL